MVTHGSFRVPEGRASDYVAPEIDAIARERFLQLLN
jgi:hypothetical protein